MLVAANHKMEKLLILYGNPVCSNASLFVYAFVQLLLQTISPYSYFECDLLAKKKQINKVLDELD